MLLRSPLQLLLVLAICGTFDVADVRAHETAAVLGVLVPSQEPLACGQDEGTRPAVMRTSIGPMFLTEAGTYGLDCPSLHADEATPDVVATSDGAVLATMRGGDVWFSDDLGCSYEALPMPGDGYFAYSFSASLQTIWVLVRDSERAVLQAARPGTWAEVRSWNRGEAEPDAFTPDTVAAALVGGETWVIVAGARPRPAVWIGRGDADGLDWTQVLDETALGAPQRLSVKSVDSDGSFWMHVTDDDGRSAVRVTMDSQTLEASVEATGVVAQSLSGPIPAFDAWWLLRDGELMRSADGVAWTSVAQTDWKCLERIGERVYACDLYQMLEVVEPPSVGLDPSELTRPVFSMWQVDDPAGRCDWDTSSEDACALDWVHYGSENYFLNRDASICPLTDPPPVPTDGAPLLDDAGGYRDDAGGDQTDAEPADAPAERGRGGCAAVNVGSVNGLGLCLLLLLLRLYGRRRCDRVSA